MIFPASVAALLLAGAPPGADETPRAAAITRTETTVIERATLLPRPPASAPAAYETAAYETAASTAPDAPEPGLGTEPTDIVVTARPHAPPGDPFEKANAQSFAATQAVDRAFTAPAAVAYQRAVPRPIRSGLRNFLGNLHEPDVFLNFLLQFKLGKAAETLGRFAINTTIGAAGLFDIAKKRPFNLPHRPNGFANTLGYYGVKPGPFMYLPLIGPTTLRDLIGGGLDRLILPVAVGKPFTQPAVAVAIGAVSTLDHRAEVEVKLIAMREGADPSYVASREFYLQRRQAEIDALHGRPHDPNAPATELTGPGVSRPSPTSVHAARD